jgi:hypothetical protein
MKKTLLTIIALTSLAISNAQNGNVIFDDATIHEIRFDNVDTTTFFLYANKGLYSMCKITIDGTIIDSIGATTKGNISWNHPNNKKPLKINLNEFVRGKKYDGIKKFYLHNSLEDPSLMRDKLTYDICEQMGLHSLRTAFSKVYINNVYWGLYTLVEAKDELYKRDFNNKNSEVYETYDLGSPCVFSQDYVYWQIDNGNPAPTWPRLQLLTDKLANTPVGEYLDTIPKYINITDFFKYQAVNVYLLNFDSYLQFNGNQLYLFDSIVENRFQIIPWDFNDSFGLWNTNNYNPNTLDVIPSLISSKCPFDKLNVIPQFKNTYLDAMCLLKNIICDTLTLNNKITYFYNQIKAAVYADTRKTPTNSQFDLGANYGYQIIYTDNAPGLKTFVNERWLKINTDLQSLPYTCTTGIELVSTSSLIVYPNPTSDIFYINDGRVGTKFTIVNMLGQTELSGSINSSNNFEINITNLNTGLYFLITTESNGIVTVHKIIKE